MTANMFSFFVILGCSLFSSLGFLYLRSSRNKNSKYFYVPAEKSKSNAILLGGLPVLLANLIGVFLLFKNTGYSSLYLSGIIFAAILGVGGWIDDKFEIRARNKLAVQLISVGGMSLTTVFLLNQGVLAFMAYFFIGMTYVNGMNLLDGLDTMSIKLSSVLFGTFFIVSLVLGNPNTQLLSLLAFSTLWTFYPFNKYPSTVHLGEVGSSHLGFMAFITTISSINATHSQIAYHAWGLSLLPFLIPFTELFVSFTRRLLDGGSPFRGDKMHLHHILRSKYQMSVPKTVNVMALYLTVTSILAIAISHHVSAVLTFINLGIVHVATYSFFCFDHWKFSSKKETSALFIGFKESTIQYIDIKNLEENFFKDAA